MAKCGREECVFEAISRMIEKMKKEIAERQNIAYPEQIVVAEIYYLTASTLAEACRRVFKISLENCEEAKEHREAEVSMDTFILLKTLSEEGWISKEYKEKLLEMLLRMKPSLRAKVEADRKLGLL